MKNHSVDISDLVALGCTDISITSASRTADTASLSFVLSSPDAEPPWAWCDEVTLTDGNNVLFCGYVLEEPDVSIDAGGIRCNLTLGNIVAILDAVPYVDAQSFKDLVTSKTRLVSAAAAIGQIVQAGLCRPGGESSFDTVQVNFNSSILCPVGSGSQTCWSLINACLHWIPNAATWYNPKERRLVLHEVGQNDVLTLDLAEKCVKKGDDVLFTFAGYEEANFRPRRDLCPPAVGLVWEDNMKSSVYGSSLRQPWAFVFQVPVTSGAYDLKTMPPEQQRLYQDVTQQKMLVLGEKVPTGWATTGNMKTEMSAAPGPWHKFWSSFPAMAALKNTNVSCLAYGLAVFEPVAGEDAYPEEDGEAQVPENYKAFTTSDSIYVLTQGQFPASTESRENINGLKFCKGKLKQYVWLDKQYTGKLSTEEWQEFFAGSAKASIGGESGKNTRYALLELDAIFINRRRKAYQTGTNKLLDPADEDFNEEEDAGGGAEESVAATDNDYKAAALDFYNATRKLYYDGSITLRGVVGYTPAHFDGTSLNIVGARTEWETMDTPIIRAEYHPQFQTLTISTGSPEILSIDERVQRTLIGRQAVFAAGTSLANVEPKKSESENPDEETQEEEKPYPMVSPSISAQATVTKSGRPLNPFQMYSEGSGEGVKWFINGGSMAAPGGRVVTLETTDITGLVLQFPNDKFTVRVERKEKSNEWKAVIRHYTPKTNNAPAAPAQ